MTRKHGRPTTRRQWLAWLPLTALLGAAGCDGGSRGPSRWVAQVDTLGDTIVVRTISGSIGDSVATLVPVFQVGELEGREEYLFGDIQGLAVDSAGAVYIADAQVPAVRRYGPDGRYVTTIGREGSGPGEYRRGADALAILPDGRLVLRDQGNSRFQLWTADGEPAGQWELRTGFTRGGVHEVFQSSGGPGILLDTAGFLYRMSTDFGDWTPGQTRDPRQRLVRYSPDGVARDTLEVPDWSYAAPTISARGTEAGGRGGGMGREPVPFSPSEEWTLSPLGYLVAGVSTEYAVYLLRPEGTLRIERAVAPVPVDPAEKANAKDLATDGMRTIDRGWGWNGPPIPDTKPPFLALLASQEGRIWVRVSQPGVRIPESEVLEPDPAPDGRRRAARRWREPVAFDVFEPDGRYRGRVHAPAGFSLEPRPVIRGDTVWAVTRDALDVQRLARFRVEGQAGQSPAK